MFSYIGKFLLLLLFLLGFALEAGTWASRLEYGPRGQDLGLMLGGRRGEKEEEEEKKEKEKFPHV